jgi:hypothetical protein
MSEESKLPAVNVSLADELGIGESLDPVFSGRGRLFSTAGPATPVAEFTDDYLNLYPPQKPLDEGTFAEEIVVSVNENGVLLNELGEPRRITGAKYRSRELFCLEERSDTSGKHLVAWFDDAGKRHRLFWQGVELSIYAAFKLRNATHDGEISMFPDLTTE